MNSPIPANTPPQISSSFRGEIYQESSDNTKIISMTGVTEEQFRTAIAAIFPNWILGVVWEDDEEISEEEYNYYCNGNLPRW